MSEATDERLSHALRIGEDAALALKGFAEALRNDKGSITDAIDVHAEALAGLGIDDALDRLGTSIETAGTSVESGLSSVAEALNEIAGKLPPPPMM